MFILDHRGTTVDESSAIEAQSLDRFEPMVSHDWRTCDCYEKVDRLVELTKKGELNDVEKAEHKFLRKVLETSNVLS